MNILQKIFAGAKAFIQHLIGFLPNWVKNTMPDIIAFTSNLKKALESDLAADAIDWIPGKWDTATKDWLLKVLAAAAPNLIEIEKCDGNLICIIQELVAWIKGDNGTTQNMKLAKLASTMLAAADDFKLPERRYDTYAQAAYDIHAEIKSESNKPADSGEAETSA